MEAANITQKATDAQQVETRVEVVKDDVKEVCLKAIGGTNITVMVGDGDRVQELRQKAAHQLEKLEIELHLVCGDDALTDDVVVADLMGKEDIYIVVEDPVPKAVAWLETQLDVGSVQLEQLKMLELYDKSLDSTDMLYLLVLAPHLTNTKLLWLYSNAIDDVGAATLAKALPSMVNFQELYLRNNKIGNGGAAALASVLPSLRNLRYLDLESCHIGDEGAAALAILLPRMANLEGLYMSRNGDIGCAAKEQIKNAAPPGCRVEI